MKIKENVSRWATGFLNTLIRIQLRFSVVFLVRAEVVSSIDQELRVPTLVSIYTQSVYKKTFCPLVLMLCLKKKKQGIDYALIWAALSNPYLFPARLATWWVARAQTRAHARAWTHSNFTCTHSVFPREKHVPQVKGHSPLPPTRPLPPCFD